MYKYVISTYSNGTEFIVESHYSTFHELEFEVIDLLPATLYNISVDVVMAAVKYSTECLTKPATGTEYKIQVQNYKKTRDFQLLFCV